MLDRIFLGQYLQIMSINRVAINKDLEKLPPQLYQIKMKIPYHQGYNDIGVVIAKKWLNNQIFLSSNRLKLSLRSSTHDFKINKTTPRRDCNSKGFRFLQITAEHQDCPFFTLFLTRKISSQNISKTLPQISLKPHEHRGNAYDFGKIVPSAEKYGCK